MYFVLSLRKLGGFFYRELETLKTKHDLNIMDIFLLSQNKIICSF